MSDDACHKKKAMKDDQAIPFMPGQHPKSGPFGGGGGNHSLLRGAREELASGGHVASRGVLEEGNGARGSTG
ncbi:uncharacterized protein G2W53_011515 [Senna tora]|uniref:Uncharacterized protein n=1 Tax=Senna tora TaxID=362788 RepID=A0A835CCH6_9FABA|nr:uncharacterized protein G2W53_011515 [Senna tora]